MIDALTKPYLGGVIDGGVWIEVSGGMMGYIRRVALSRLSSTANPQGEAGFWSRMPPPIMSGYHSLSATVVGRVLYVFQPYGGRGRNYCGDPISGQERATLDLPLDGVVVWVSGRTLIYLDFAGRWTSLARVALSPRCFGKTVTTTQTVRTP